MDVFLDKGGCQKYIPASGSEQVEDGTTFRFGRKQCSM